MVKSTFATIFTLMSKYGSKCGLCHVCYRFALEQRYICNTFALCKFNVNPFFRPVSFLSVDSNIRLFLLHMQAYDPLLCLIVL